LTKITLDTIPALGESVSAFMVILYSNFIDVDDLTIPGGRSVTITKKRSNERSKKIIKPKTGRFWAENQ